MQELPASDRQNPDSVMLLGFWYRAIASEQLTRDRMHTATLLEIPLVLGRDASGNAFALRDACPHRGMPLSCGQFDGQNVECSYHGWKFDAHSGQCQLIPSLTADQKLKVDRIYAGSYRLRRARRFRLGLYSRSSTRRARDSARRSSRRSRRRGCRFSATSIRLAYLTADTALQRRSRHYRLNGPGARPVCPSGLVVAKRGAAFTRRQKNFEPIPSGFRMSAHTPSSNSAPYKLLRLYADADSITTTIDFVLPNLRLETIRAGKYWFSSADHGNADHAQPMPY